LISETVETPQGTVCASLSSRGQGGTIRPFAPSSANRKIVRDGGIDMPIKRFFNYAVIALTALSGALGVREARAQTYPARDITFVVAFAPGGVADTLARFVGKGLSERLDRTVVVENRGGAGGNIAAAAVARAAPDGYTLLVTTTAVAINETLRPNKGFAVSDLKPIAIVASSPESLVTSPGNPAGNLADFLKAAKSKNITFGSAGVGSGSHIAAEYFFKEIAKISATHVPFQGGAPAIAATIGNQIDLLATTLGGGAAAQIASGKLKGLGVASTKRAAVTPNVLTYAEAGYPFEASSWVGVFAPANTSPEITAKLNTTIEQVMKDPALRQKLTSIGFDPIEGSQSQAETYFNAEVAQWGKMVTTLGLSIK
jgi:tripartite-type tricarboxylate transporter receptor subunit TctC